VGYVAMGRYLPHAGAFYAYISHGLGKSAGVGAAWLALVAYNCLQIALYGGVGVAASPLIEQFFSIRLAWWVYALIAWALVAGLGVLRVDLNGSVLAVLLTAEIVILVIYDFVFVTQPHGGSIDFSTLSPSGMFAPGATALLAIVVLAFSGFESSVVFSEESKNPRRTIPLATFTAILLIVVLYGLSSWAMAVAAGSDNIVDVAREQEIGTMFGLAAERLGGFWGDLGSVLFLTSMLAALISFHNTISRYVFALGREGVLPSFLGGTSPSGAPRAGSLTQSVIALVVILIYAIGGLDPLVGLFYTVGTSGGYGLLILIAWTSYAVYGYFRRNPQPESAWRVTVLPLLAVVVMSLMFVLATLNFATMLGVPDSDPLRWGVPAAYVVIGVLGTLYGARLRSSRPRVYAAIGMGAKSNTITLPDSTSRTRHR